MKTNIYKIKYTFCGYRNLVDPHYDIDETVCLNFLMPMETLIIQGLQKRYS